MIHADETEVLEIRFKKPIPAFEALELGDVVADQDELIASLRGYVKELQRMLDSNSRMIGQAALVIAEQTNRRHEMEV
jgi:Mg2+ and Co2+ transporter CorA